ncbi:MAG: MBL fold metallo-hydrolase [Chitinophagales bacterium]|nr:MBL fold metallo-hydrolase [Chitinophagales bacterium]
MEPIAVFAFNPFQENTYVIAADNGECLIIDCGCYHSYEQVKLRDYLKKNNLRPVRLLQTHCHIDHVFGNAFINEAYGLLPECHPLALGELAAIPSYAAMMGVKYQVSPQPQAFINEGDTLKLGNLSFKILFTPGHSPGSICFYNETEGYIIAGDVLFRGSIGRTDLPGGSMSTLTKSIQEKLYRLPDETIVYPGHGEPTTIGGEKRSNPFVRQA